MWVPCACLRLSEYWISELRASYLCKNYVIHWAAPTWDILVLLLVWGISVKGGTGIFQGLAWDTVFPGLLLPCRSLEGADVCLETVCASLPTFRSLSSHLMVSHSVSSTDQTLMVGLVVEHISVWAFSSCFLACWPPLCFVVLLPRQGWCSHPRVNTHSSSAVHQDAAAGDVFVSLLPWLHLHSLVLAAVDVPRVCWHLKRLQN